MIPHPNRSSIASLERQHCPAAVAHAKLGTTRESDRETMVGRVVHAVMEAVANNREHMALEVADAATIGVARNGISFEGAKPEFPTLEEACEGRRFALAMLDKHPLPEATWMQAEMECNLSPNGWAVVEGSKCATCSGEGGGHRASSDPGQPGPWEVCTRCEGAGGTWPEHWHQLLDLVYRAEEEDAYESPIAVAGGIDWKGWLGGRSWFDGLQGAGYAVALASLFPDADVIRRGCGSYQLRCLWWDEIDLRTEEGQDRLEDYRRDIQIYIEADRGKTTDIEALALPGAGCFSGYAGCPHFARCDPAQRRAAELVAMGSSWGSFGSIEGSAEAFALGKALYQEGAKQLKDYGGGPIRTPSGHLVGWKDTTSPTGAVDPNASLWLGREWAIFVANRPGDAPIYEGVIRAAGVGKSGGVTAVKKLVAKIVSAGMDEEEGEALLDRCLGPKPGRALDVWRGELPQEDEDQDLVEKLRQSIKLAKEKK